MKVPTPGLRNAHLNTIFASQGPRAWRVRRGFNKLVPKAEEVILDCGEARLHGEYNASPDNPRGLVILIHGWLGCAQSIYALAATKTLYKLGYSVFRLHLRDHGPSITLNREPFLAIRHLEVAKALSQIERLYPHETTHLIGYSLGGNIALRAAAALGCHESNQDTRLRRVIAVCPPVDPAAASRMISESSIFNRHFTSSWRKAFQQKIDHFPEYEQHGNLLSGDNIVAQHEAYVPVFSSYPDATSYFRAYTLNRVTLAGLDTPATIIASADDPCIPADSLHLVDDMDQLSVELTPHGGHCGFLTGYRSESWLEQRLPQLLAS